VLINPYNLSEILKRVSLQLPAGLTMLTGLTDEDMYVYYTVAKVHAVATSTSIRLFIDIPLKAVDRYFQLYQVYSFLFFHKGIGQFVVIDETFTYLAVAENRQFFAVMTPYMLSKCTRNLYTVCPSDVILKTAGEQNCLIALFLGKMDIVLKKCKRLVLHEPFEPIWIRSPDSSYWVYSLNVPQQVTIQCRTAGPPPASKSNYQLTFQGTGILRNSSSCYVHAENFKLLPHSLGNTKVDLDEVSIVLPNIDNILHLSEEHLLKAEAKLPLELPQLNHLVERAASRSYTREIDVSKTIVTLQNQGITHLSSLKIWIISVAVIVTGLVILWIIWIKSPCENCPCIRRKHNTPNMVELELNESNVAFQVVTERSTGHAEDSSCLQRTAFASREIDT